MPRAYDPKAAQRGIFDALLDARDKWGGKRPILEDQERRVLTYTDLIRASFALGRKIAGMTEKGERVAILLPTGVGSSVVFFALHAFGRVPVMLNFSAGIRNVRTACKTAGIKRILTAHRFIDQGKLEDLVDALEIKYEITWLEDVRAKIGIVDKLRAALDDKMARKAQVQTGPNDPGVILFTSGSYGAPKGVVLTQGGLLANVDQVAAAIDLNPDWVFFNPLPVFHAFGLLGGVLLPILSGLKAFNYPSPLHVKQIPPLIKEVGASVLLATDTFLSQYGRSSEADELSGLEFIVCGAERVRNETHDFIAARFGGIPVIEGYGATEASPVIAVNTPLDNRRGTVGGLLPGMEARLEPIEGIEGGAKLLVRGPNIMAGYLREDGTIEQPGEWYDTGDVVSMTDDNWITILGRVKRFAKIAGEMVSLTAAETLASQVWPDARHAVIAMPDSKKGERLVLITDRFDASVAKLLEHAQATGASELSVPRKIVKAPEIPVLGTGKTDYVAVQRIAESDIAKAA
jgi:acyl-[acyl-carrier-protein]-phospholipid O-acyltransferase/long-chain-fatty-acid--[acyl-carrier-protein] ligase